MGISSYPFYTVNYYIKWVTTSWTDSKKIVLAGCWNKEGGVSGYQIIQIEKLKVKIFWSSPEIWMFKYFILSYPISGKSIHTNIAYNHTAPLFSFV